MNLAALLDPLSPEQFFAEKWTKAACRIPGEPSKDQMMVGWSEVNDILCRELAQNQIRVLRDRRIVAQAEYAVPTSKAQHLRVSPQRLALLLAGGGSMVLQNADYWAAAIRATVESLGVDLGEHVHANIYCSWPGSDGFGPHFDGHEVFAIQVAGRKRWEVFPATLELPLEGLTNNTPAAYSRPPTEPYCVVELTPGDVIYVPRGHWHRVEAIDQPSLHVTFGVTCRNGLLLLDWLRRILAERPGWREGLPLGFGLAVDDVNRRAVVDKVRSLCEELAEVALGDTLPSLLVDAERVAALAAVSGGMCLPGQACTAGMIEDDTPFTVAALGRRLRDASLRGEILRAVNAIDNGSEDEARLVDATIASDRCIAGRVASTAGLENTVSWQRVREILAGLTRFGMLERH